MSIDLQQLVDDRGASRRDPGCGHCGWLAAYVSNQGLGSAVDGVPPTVDLVNDVPAIVKEMILREFWRRGGILSAAESKGLR